MTIKISSLKKGITGSVLSISTLAVAVVMPQIFHYFGLGKEFLPMYLPLVVLAFIAENRWSGLVPAILAPVISFALFGMPVLPVALLVALELSFIFLSVRQTRIWNWNFFPALPAALLAGRVISLIGNWVLNHGSFEKAWAFTASAWPGLIALTVIGMLTGLVRASSDNEK